MSELDPRQVERIEALGAELRSLAPGEAQAALAGMAANWRIPTPEEIAAARRRGRAEPKPRATHWEMAERFTATRWLVEEAGRPLSRRGVAYRAEALIGLPKTAKAFRYIEEATLDLRDSALIDWELIRDGRRAALRHGRYPDLGELLRSAASNYRRGLWAEAPVQVQAWIEKADLAGALAERAHAIGLDVYPGSGFTGAGFLRAAIKEAAADPRPLFIIEFVDYDSSGQRMGESYRRRVERFAADLGVGLAGIERAALTREHRPAQPLVPVFADHR